MTFNRPLQEVLLPATLCELHFSNRFDQVLDGICWPSSLVLTSIILWLPRVYQLETLVLGRFFQQDLRYVPLPQSLLRLALGECFPLERHSLFWPRGTQHQAAVCPTADRLLVSGNPAQAGLRWRHFGTVTKVSCREEKRTAVLPALASRLCMPVARTAVLLAWPHSFRLSSRKRKKGWQE